MTAATLVMLSQLKECDITHQLFNAQMPMVHSQSSLELLLNVVQVF